MNQLLYISMGRLLAICGGFTLSILINIIILFYYLAQKFPGLFFEDEEPEQDNRPKSKYFINL